jgi:hypothetical protein
VIRDPAVRKLALAASRSSRGHRAQSELARFAAQDRLRKARARLRAARARWARARKTLSRTYRSARARARARFKAYRVAERERVKRQIAHWWAELQAHWASRRAHVRALAVPRVERAKVAAEHERARLRDLGRHHERVERHLAGHRKREAEGESDDRVIYDLSAHHPELVPVFRKVRHLIRGSARMSRTEAMLHWAHDHSDEALALRAADEDRELQAAIREHQEAERAAHRTRKTRPATRTRAAAGVPF